MQDLPRKENSGVKRIEQIKRLRVEIEKARTKSAAINEKLIPYEDWRKRSIELIDNFFHDEESYENVDMVSESLEYSDPDSDIGGIVSSSQSDPDFDEPKPQVQATKPASYQHHTQKKTNPQLNLQPQAPLQSIGVSQHVSKPIISKQPNTTLTNVTNPMNQQASQLKQQNYGNLSPNVTEMYQYLRSFNTQPNNLQQTNQTTGLPQQNVSNNTQAIPKKPPPVSAENYQPQKPPKPNQPKEKTKPEPPKQADSVSNSMLPRFFEAEIDMPTSRTIMNAQTKFMTENIDFPISPFNYAPCKQLIDKKLKESLLQQKIQEQQAELKAQKALQEKLEAQRIQQEKLAEQKAQEEKLKEQARKVQQENRRKQEQVEKQKKLEEQKKIEQAMILKQAEMLEQQKKEEQRLMKEKREFKVDVSRPNFQLNKYGFYEAYGKKQINEQSKFSNQVFASHNPPEKTKELLDKIAQASKMQPKPVNQEASNNIPSLSNLLNQHQPQLISQTQSYSTPTQQNSQQTSKLPQKTPQQTAKPQQQMPKQQQTPKTPPPHTTKPPPQQAPKTPPPQQIHKTPSQNQQQNTTSLPKTQHQTTTSLLQKQQQQSAQGQAKPSQPNITVSNDQSEKNTRASTPQASKNQIPTSTPLPFAQTSKTEKSFPKNQFYSPNIKDRQAKPPTQIPASQPVTPKKSEKKLKDIEESLKKDKQMSMTEKEKAKRQSTPEAPLLSTIKIPSSPNKVPSLSPAWSLSNRQNLGAKAGFPFTQTAKVPQFQGAWSVGQKNKEESQPSFQYKRQVKKEKPNPQEKPNTDNQTKPPNNKQTQQFAGFSEVVKDFWQKKKKE